MTKFFVKSFVLIFGVVIGTSLFTMPYLGKLTKLKRLTEIKINEQIIIAEVAGDSKSREQGLSGREDIGINEGMLFLFEEAERPGFWMKGMNFPIDIIWINESRVVGVTENLLPEPGVHEASLKIYYPPEPINKVLEVRAGRAGLLGVKAGDEVKIRPLLNRS